MDGSGWEHFQRSEEQLRVDSGRQAKPRTSGITMVLVFDVANYGPEFIRPFSKLVDKVKLLDTLWHDDPSVVRDAVAAYREMDISVACGGTQFEVAVAQNSVEDYIRGMKGVGISEVEIEHHADDLSSERIREEVQMFKGEGFDVVGEVGKKWWWRDPTRQTRDLINVDKTVEDIGAYLDAGADWIYWEGAVVGGLIGRQLENEKGQEQLLEVTRQIDLSRVIFEVYDRRNQAFYPMVAWLVRNFGPNVNLANIDPWMVKRVEWIRNGIAFEMDHPYQRWKADPTVSEAWWNIPDVPDYSVDVQRPYALYDAF